MWNGFLKIKCLHLPFDPSYNMLVHPRWIHMWESSHYLTILFYRGAGGGEEGSQETLITIGFLVKLKSHQLPLLRTFTSLSQLDAITLISQSETTAQPHS